MKQVKAITEEIKRLSDERALTLDEVDRLLTDAQRSIEEHHQEEQHQKETQPQLALTNYAYSN